MKLSALAKDLEPYIIKLVRKIVGDLQFAGVKGDGLTYRLRLVDQSARVIKEFEVYALGSGDYADIYSVMMTSGDGDTILIPSGTFQFGFDTDEAASNDISFVGESRAQTILAGSIWFAAGGGSVENCSLIESYNSAADIRPILLYAAGTLNVNDVHIEITQTGSGDVRGISAEDADAVIHVWNSYIKSNASGAGAGYAAYSDGEVHFHGGHIIYNDAVADPGGSGTVYLWGVTAETI